MPKQIREQSYLTPHDQRLGLCSTCNEMDLCINRKNWAGPLHFCEQFDDSAPRRPAKTDLSEPKKKTNPDNAEQLKDGVDHRGLCVNCAQRQTCKFPKPAGGVWHCSEYL